jgi:N-acetylmuramoyl-L-alanine amidase
MEDIRGKTLEKVNTVFTVSVWTTVSVVFFAVMFYVASHKTIVISDTRSDKIDLSMANVEGQGRLRSLLVEKDDSAEGELYIPLEKGIKAENVLIENRYTDKELCVHINGADESFYDTNAVTGDTGVVLQGECETLKDSVVLRLKMDGIYEYHTTMNDNQMSISFEKPDEAYGMVVVIDPMGGGDDTGTVLRGYAEKTLAMQIAEKIPDKITNNDICIYFTRTDDLYVNDEDRSAFAEDCHADIYIRIGVSSDEDEEAYGISGIYNGKYYIPDFGNTQLADIITRNVTIAASDRAVSLIEAESTDMISRLKIPAMQINVGYFSNSKESSLLAKDEYRDRLAQGIAMGIEEAYEELMNTDKQ